MDISPDRALEIGKAGEHLVCADLIIQGYRAFLSDQGLPYDVLVDHEGRFIRVQVKSCGAPRNVNSQGRNPRIAYNFSVRIRGKEGQSRLSNDHCDVVALVALDIKTIAYLPITAVGTTVQLRPPNIISETRSNLGWAASIDQLPFSIAISKEAHENPDLVYVRRAITECRHGHPYPENERVGSNGSTYCYECSKIAGRESARRRRAAKKEIRGEVV